MKNFFKGLIIFLLVTTIIVIIPVKLITNISNIHLDSATIDGQYETFTQKNSKLINEVIDNTNARGLAIEMSSIAGLDMKMLRIESYYAIGYLSLVLTILILIIGIYGLKKWENKKYISKALILSSIVSILWLIFWIVEVYFTRLR